uniref:ATP-binding protein n=1 Tax=Agathobacter sp. TaxID=2021311 RepID=UPI0040577975
MRMDKLSDYIFNNMKEMVVVFDTEGNVTYANRSAAEKLEYAEDILTTSITDIFPKAFSDEYDQEDILDFNGKEKKLMAYRKNRTCFPVLANLSILEDDEQYVCLMDDITQRTFLEKKIEKVEQEAQSAMKVKSEFVANVTHELRTPVNGILGNTKELLNRVNNPECCKILDRMERGCRDMNAIINNILDFSKLEAGRFTLENREFDFRKMIDYVKSNHAYPITEKGLEFFVTISPEVPTHVIGDELRIVQILNNLISNATKFTAVGKIAVEAVKTAQTMNKAEIFFLIKDTGIGIAKEDVDKLFKSFSQVDASVTRKYGGTGLGLNISKQLVEMMHGHIGVESELNKGSMFSFSIWVELPETEIKENTLVVDMNAYLYQASRQQNAEETALREFGNPKNRDALKKNMSKLILSVEMDNWEKAEGFVNALRQLTINAPQEIRSCVLRLKLAVQNMEYEAVATLFETLSSLV